MSADRQESWEAAVAWLLSRPEHRELCEACYFDRPALQAAQRFARSEEWMAVRSLLPESPGIALDLGSGMGIAAYALAASGWRVVALEPDPSDLVGAGAIRALAAQSGMAIDVVEQFGEQLPAPDGRFDLVFCRQALHHARDLPRLCREAYRVLRPGGLLIATREHVVSSSRQLRQFLDAHPLQAIYGGEHAYSLSEYRRALLQAGFTRLREIGPMESVINYAPLTESGLADDVARRAARIPGGRRLARLLLARPLRSRMLTVLSRIDRRPGRLYSFVASRAAEAAA